MSPAPPDSRPRMGRHEAAGDSVPPDSTEDPHGPDRHGQRRRHILPADAERGRGLYRVPIGHRDLIEQITLGRCAPVHQERLVLPGIQLAAAGRFGGFDRAGGAALVNLGRTATAVAVAARSLRNDLGDERHGHHRQPDGFLQDANQRRASRRAFLIPILRLPAGNGLPNPCASRKSWYLASDSDAQAEARPAFWRQAEAWPTLWWQPALRTGSGARSCR